MTHPGNEDTFFDIHMHAFNLSHPNFYAFLARYKLLPESILNAGMKVMTLVVAGIVLLVGVVFGIVFALVYFLASLPFVASLVISVLGCILLFVLLLLGVRDSVRLRRFIQSNVDKFRNNLNNMLSVFENDIGSFFLVMENCLRETDQEWQPLLRGNRLTIGNDQSRNEYERVVLTPLMMDFGRKSKEMDRQIHYKESAAKPINEQVMDVLNAVKWYREATYAQYSTRLTKAYPFLKEDGERFFEIYPFMGINTQNYEPEEVDSMLKKYFSAYRGSRDDFYKNLGQFNGNVRSIGSNFFAGVKVYPPLGFDPWPQDGGKEQQKVETLYKFCQDHQVPITTHGGSSGFVAIEDDKRLLSVTSMAKWKSVVQKYPSLKLNIAHFPAEIVGERARRKSNYKQERERFEALRDLVLTSDNVYTDFSCRAVEDDYYRCLKAVLSSLSGPDKQKLTSRILFGSDFAVVLGSIDSYSRYVYLFSNTPHLSDTEKHAFCCVNPQHFLFT